MIRRILCAKEMAMNQRARIKAYLESGRALTRLNAWDELGVLECPARISELRAQGVEIATSGKLLLTAITRRYQ